MAELFTLTAGRNKQRLKRVMTDTREKCENYKKALITSGNPDFTWFKISPAQEGEEPFKRKSSSQWTGYDVHPKRIK